MIGERHLAQAIIEGTSDAIFVKDVEGRYLLVNQAAADFIGRPREAILGRTDREWFSGATLPELLARDQRVMRQGSWETREETLTSNGTRTYSATKGPLRDEDGSVVGLVGISRDITRQKENEESLRRSNEALERFAHVVSHDLREPLSAMMMNVAYARTKLKTAGVEVGAERLAQAEAAGTRMHERIQALFRDASLVQSTRPFVVCEAAAVVRTVIADLAPRVRESGATIEVSTLPRVWADEVLLAQLFQNLLLNAIRHSEREGPHVLVSAEAHGDRWRFAIDDDGRGIAPGDRARVFLPYQRLARTDGQSVSGSGIGLSTCKRIVERHGGNLWVEPSPYGGARFCFTLSDPAAPLLA